MKKNIYLFFIVALPAFISVGAQPPMNIIEDAARHIREAKHICDNDGGNLWGVNLYSPVLFINPQRGIIASESDPEGILVKQGGLYTGNFPEEKIIANSTTELGGKNWTMVMWPLPEDDYARNSLIIHEMFHYWQDGLGLTPPASYYSNSHMDDMEARILMRLEWEALERAVCANSEEERDEAIGHAVYFREYRRELYAGSRADENTFEIHEGMAEYTAKKLCSEDDDMMAAKLRESKNVRLAEGSIVRTFAYHSGAIYGHLLDGTGNEWRKDLKADSDLGLTLIRARRLDLPDNNREAYEKIRNDYGYEDIYASEKSRAEASMLTMTENKMKFIDNPVFVIPLKKFSFGFDPRRVNAFENHGTVYGTIRIVMDSGTLEVSDGGCLISPDWTKAIVPASGIVINETGAEADGWTFVLNEGFEIFEDGENYSLNKKPEIQSAK